MKLTLIHFFIHYAGYITFAEFLVSIYFLWAIIKHRVPWKEARVEFVLALAMTAMVFLSVRVDLKVLSDETNLLSVANMLAYEGKASNTQQWVWYYDTFHALDVSAPTRPILYPLLVSLVHMVLGISLRSAFIINFICLFLLNFLSLRFVRKICCAEIYPQYVMALILLMNSVMSIIATSAGFDLCSLLFGFATFLLLQQYYQNKTSENLRVLFYLAICFSSVRYESILALPIIAIFLMFDEGYRVVKKLQFFDYLLGAFFISPLLAQRIATWGSFENPEGVAPFAAEHFFKHLPIFMNEFFVNGNGPYPIIVHILGVIGILTYLKNTKGIRLEAKAVALYVGILLTILLSHHFGFAGHPTQVRLFLPISFFLCLFSVYALSELRQWVHVPSVFIIFFVLLFHHHKYSVQDPLTSTLSMTREVWHIRNFIHDSGRVGDIYVYDRPGQLSAIGMSVVSWDQFNAEKNRYLTEMKNHLYQRMLMIERVQYNGDPAASSLIREGYRLSPLFEQQTSPEERLRISRMDW